MNILGAVVLLAFPVIALAFYALLPGRRAMLAVVVGGVLFLPMGGFDLPGLPPYNKATAIALGMLLGMALFDAQRMRAFRPRWWDIPMVVWCAVPFFSSITNNLGPYDGASGVLRQVLYWGVPYFVGRVYFADLGALRELAVAIIVGGIVYVPLCLLEIWRSPQLHRLIYGFYQHSFLQHMRYGGYRPMVFMQHGLAVGWWMAAATLAAYSAWRLRWQKEVAGLPMGGLFGVLFVTVLLCKAVSAIGLLLLGMVVLELSRRAMRVWLFVLLATIVPAYIGARTTSGLPTEKIGRLAGRFVDEQRVESFTSRLVQEDVLVGDVLQRPVFGLSYNVRFTTETGERRLRGWDSMWLISLYMFGFVGLVSLCLSIMLPALAYVWRSRSFQWDGTLVPAGTVLSLILLLWMIDNLANAMLNPVWVLAAGGLATVQTLCSLPRLSPATCTLRKPAGTLHRGAWRA